MIGEVNEKDIIMEKKLETSPPLMNQLSVFALTITGTIAVFRNRTTKSLKATERLYSV